MMKMTMAEAQERGIWVSTHDKCVTEVNCGEDYVEFHFAGGFDVVKNGEAESTGAACVRFDGCTADDFDCFIMRKRPSPKGWRIRAEVPHFRSSAQCSKKSAAAWSCTRR